ncbi:MAG: hypothetical protein FWD82_00450 [Defluviitaleaceae bacterium]|nr:hypothetical protein [Defluviitaleaceae bacterium]
MTKKLITIAVSIIMLFSIVAFTACNTTNADLLARIEALEQERQVIATLTQRIEALEAQNEVLQGIIDDLQSGAVYNEAQIELLQEQIGALQDFVEELIEQINELIESADYTNANLLELIQALQRQVEGLQERIKELEIQLLKAGREWGYSECGRFAMSILVKENTRSFGENFTVEAKLVNLSNVAVEISFYASHSAPFHPKIYNWDDQAWAWWYWLTFGRIPISKTIESGKYLRKNWDNIGGRFVGDTTELSNEIINQIRQEEHRIILFLGTHELIMRTIFTLNFGQENQELILFYSNAVELTVTIPN